MSKVSGLLDRQNVMAAPTTPDRQYIKVNHATHWSHFCVHDVLRISNYLRELRQIGAWDQEFVDISVEKVLSKFHDYKSVDLPRLLGYGVFEGKQHECASCSWHSRTQLAGILNAVEKESGLCIDCDASKKDESNHNCRMGH